MRTCRIHKALVSLLLTLAFANCGRAQSSDGGTLEGVVADRSGAVVPGVSLKARNLQTSILLTTSSNERGLFRFSVLPVGTYDLVAECAGFAPLIIHNVTVTIGAHVTLNLVLSVAGRVESLMVGGADPGVEITRSQQSSTIDQNLLASLPDNGRNFAELVLLTPGVTTDVRTGLASFAGQRSMNSLLVDGTDTNQTFFGLPMGGGGFSRAPYQFSLASIQEFQVNSNAYSAEFGRAEAGVINVVTKSGTNDFHGSAFWYYRDKSMNATDAVNKLNGIPKSPYHFNQFGGVLGGPIIRNRVFFFLNYDGQRSTIQNTVLLNLPAGFVPSSDPSLFRRTTRPEDRRGHPLGSH